MVTACSCSHAANIRLTNFRPLVARSQTWQENQLGPTLPIIKLAAALDRVWQALLLPNRLSSPGAHGWAELATLTPSCMVSK